MDKKLVAPDWICHLGTDQVKNCQPWTCGTPGDRPEEKLSSLTELPQQKGAGKKKTCPGACTGAHGTYSGLKTSLAPAFGEKFRNEDQEVWEALVQSYIKFNRFPEKVLEKIWEALVPSQVRFNRVPEKVPKKGLGEGREGFGAEPGQVQQGSGEGSGEDLGGFGAKRGRVQQVSGKGFGEVCRKPWCKTKSGSTGSGGRLRRRSWGRFCFFFLRARSSSTGSTWFPALGSAARFRMMPNPPWLPAS